MRLMTRTMHMTHMKHLIAAALALASTFAQANTNCDQPRDDFDGLYCLNKVYLEADKDRLERRQFLQ